MSDDIAEEVMAKYIPILRNELSEELGNAIALVKTELQSIQNQLLPNGVPETSALSASGFGMFVDSNQTRIEDWFDDPINIEAYCLERLAEIRAINGFAKTPSAFSCIFSFMGFLSQFASEDKDESHAYRDLTVKYMRKLRCKIEYVPWPQGDSPTPRVWASGKRLGEEGLFNTWSEILYSLGRCGLLHSLSLAGNRGLHQEQLNLMLTHDVVKDATVIDLFQKDTRGVDVPAKVISSAAEVKRIVINADDLCVSVYDGILRLFQDHDAVERARKIMKDRPAIMAVVENRK